MKYWISIMTALIMLSVGTLTAWSDDDVPDQSQKKDEEKKTVDEDNPSMICENLQEKMDIFRPLQETVSHDFARISDKALCNSMSSQCEYFYSKIKEYDKAYKEACNADYALPKIEKCDYSANPCVREVKQNSLRSRTAGL